MSYDRPQWMESLAGELCGVTYHDRSTLLALIRSAYSAEAERVQVLRDAAGTLLSCAEGGCDKCKKRLRKALGAWEK